MPMGETKIILVVVFALETTTQLSIAFGAPLVNLGINFRDSWNCPVSYLIYLNRTMKHANDVILEFLLYHANLKRNRI